MKDIQHYIIVEGLVSLYEKGEISLHGALTMALNISENASQRGRETHEAVPLPCLEDGRYYEDGDGWLLVTAKWIAHNGIAVNGKFPYAALDDGDGETYGLDTTDYVYKERREISKEEFMRRLADWERK